MLLVLAFQRFQPHLRATFFLNGDQLALCIYFQDRLDIQRRAYDSCGCRDSAAPLQIHQVIHHEPERHLPLVLIQPFGIFFDGHTIFLIANRTFQQQSHATGCTKTVHRHYLCIRIGFCQFVSCHTDRIKGLSQATGQGKIQDRLSFF